MRLKISHSLYLFGAVIVLSIAVVAAFGGKLVNEVRVGGPLYTQISQGKDLVADILPPPAYVIEAYLEANLAMQAVKPLAATTERLQALRKD
jgi:hypothetical protein